MPLQYILALIGTGIGVGFASGLLGVGGCIIMTPVQYWVLTSLGFSTDIAIKVAFGTSLLVALPTVASGAWAHSRKGVVWWKAATVLGVAGLAGSLVGSTIAAHAPGTFLKILFGAIILLGAIRMATAKPPKIEQEPKDNPWLWVAWGFPTGILVGLIGIGGGVLIVPIMTLALNFKMHNAVGSSTAMIIFTSIGGITGYVINGLGNPDLPAYSIGYVNLLQWILLAGTSVPLAQVGARTAHLLPAKQLRIIFIIVMAYMGLKMVGAVP